MKKNKAMRLASVVLVLTLLSTCVISGTFAKYTTSTSGSDTARVAKWGVTLLTSGTLYGSYYSANVAAKSDAKNLEVKTSDTSKVIAPGTNCDGTGMVISISGTPEVSTALTATVTVKNIYLAKGTYGQMVAATGVTEENYAKSTYYTVSDGTYSLATGDYATGTTYYKLVDSVTLTDAYYPVIYKSDAYTAGATTADSADAMAAAIAKLWNGGTAVTGTPDYAGGNTYTITSKNYAAGTDFSSYSQTITCNWAFEQNNGADTILGLLADSTTSGSVVKLDGTSYKAPASTGTSSAPADYCTTTSVDISFALAQTDIYTDPKT